MSVLRDRLAELAEDAPTGGSPAAELWARGRRAQSRRAAALAVAVLVVVVGTGIGVRVADNGSRDVLMPAGHLGFALPIAYPAGELPSLGRTPGPLAAIWTTDTPPGGGAPTAVGLVAATGKFGTLPIDLADERPAPGEFAGDVVALSPDGRRVAWSSPGRLIVRDLVSGETYSPVFDFEPRDGVTWVDATHLVGYVAGGSDVDGWVWQPGQPPIRVNPYPWLDGYHGRDLWVFIA